jgi:hypothetical protein
MKRTGRIISGLGAIALAASISACTAQDFNDAALAFGQSLNTPTQYDPYVMSPYQQQELFQQQQTRWQLDEINQQLQQQNSIN